MSSYDSLGPQPDDFWFAARIGDNDEMRWMAIDAIRHNCSPEVSLPLFLDTLQNDSYDYARGLAAHAIFDLVIDRMIKLRPHEEMPILLAALQDPSKSVREQVAQIIALHNESNS